MNWSSHQQPAIRLNRKLKALQSECLRQRRMQIFRWQRTFLWVSRTDIGRYMLVALCIRNLWSESGGGSSTGFNANRWPGI